MANSRRPGYMNFQKNCKLHFLLISVDRVPQRIWNDRVPLKIWDDRVPQRIWDDRVPHSFFANVRWFWSHDSILLTKFHLSSLKSKKVWKKHALCAPCAPTVRPLCTPCATLVQFPKKSTVWPLRNLGPFEIDLGYCSTRSKDTAPQNQKILLHTQRKRWWDTAPQVSKDTAPHFKKKVKDTAPPPFLGGFSKWRKIFSRPVGRVPIKNFFRRGCQNLS